MEFSYQLAHRYKKGFMKKKKQGNKIKDLGEAYDINQYTDVLT